MSMMAFPTTLIPPALAMVARSCLGQQQIWLGSQGCGMMADFGLIPGLFRSEALQLRVE